MTVPGPGLRARFAFLSIVAGAFALAGAPAMAQGSAPDDSICLMIESAARDHGLPVEFFARVIWQESRFRANAVGPLTRSGKRAQGMAQFMPGTAAERGLLDPFDPVQALPKSAEFLKELWAQFGNLGLAAAAYNAGPLPVARWSYMAPADPLLWIESIPYWETRYYVPAVFRNLWVYQGLANAETPTLSALAQHRWPTFPAGRTNLAEAPEINAPGEQ